MLIFNREDENIDLQIKTKEKHAKIELGQWGLKSTESLRSWDVMFESSFTSHGWPSLVQYSLKQQAINLSAYM